MFCLLSTSHLPPPHHHPITPSSYSSSSPPRNKPSLFYPPPLYKMLPKFKVIPGLVTFYLTPFNLFLSNPLPFYHATGSHTGGSGPCPSTSSPYSILSSLGYKLFFYLTGIPCPSCSRTKLFVKGNLKRNSFLISEYVNFCFVVKILLKNTLKKKQKSKLRSFYLGSDFKYLCLSV